MKEGTNPIRLFGDPLGGPKLRTPPSLVVKASSGRWQETIKEGTNPAFGKMQAVILQGCKSGEDVIL